MASSGSEFSANPDSTTQNIELVEQARQLNFYINPPRNSAFSKSSSAALEHALAEEEQKNYQVMERLLQADAEDEKYPTIDNKHLVNSLKIYDQKKETSNFMDTDSRYPLLTKAATLPWPSARRYAEAMAVVNELNSRQRITTACSAPCNLLVCCTCTSLVGGSITACIGCCISQPVVTEMGINITILGSIGGALLGVVCGIGRWCALSHLNCFPHASESGNAITYHDLNNAEQEVVSSISQRYGIAINPEKKQSITELTDQIKVFAEREFEMAERKIEREIKIEIKKYERRQAFFQGSRHTGSRTANIYTSFFHHKIADKKNNLANKIFEYAGIAAKKGRELEAYKQYLQYKQEKKQNYATAPVLRKA